MGERAPFFGSRTPQVGVLSARGRQAQPPLAADRSLAFRREVAFHLVVDLAGRLTSPLVARRSVDRRFAASNATLTRPHLSLDLGR
jgi:hypothetical protein